MHESHESAPMLRSQRGVAPPGQLIERLAPLQTPDPATLAWRVWYRALFKRRWLVLAVAALCMLTALVYALTAPPVYRADLLLHVEEGQPNASKNILNDISSLFETKKAASAEMELLRSRLVVAPAVDTLRLYIHARPRYFPLGGEWIAQRQGSRLPAPGLFGYLGRGGYVWGGEKIEVAVFNVPDALYNQQLLVTALGGQRWRLSDGAGRTLLDGEVGKLARLETPAGPVELLITRLRGLAGAQFVLRRTSRLAALERVQRALQISEQGKLSGVITVSLQGNEPQQVYATLTEIGNEYARQNLARRTEEGQKTLTFLDRQLPLLKQQLETAEASYNSFRSQHETVDISQEVRIALDTQAQAQARRSALAQRRAELLGRYTDEHPLLVAVAQQARENERELAALEARIKRLPRIEQEQARLARDVKVGTDLYTELLNTAQQLRLMAVGSIGTVRMVDMPVAPERPIAPNRPLIVMLGLVSGLFLGALLALALRAMGGAIDDPERIEVLLGAHTLQATIAHSRGRQRRFSVLGPWRKEGSAGTQYPAQPQAPLLLTQADDAAAESLRAFRAAVEFILRHSRNNVVTCLGATRGVGAGFVSVNLALLMAASGRRTLLIDADLSHGKMHACFGIDRAAGLADCLAGVLQPQQAVRRGVAPQLDFIAVGGARPDQAELLQTRLLAGVLEALSIHYDVVLVTAPPVLAASDALAVGALAGAVFVVTRADVTTEEQLQQAVKRLHHAGIAPHGVVYNDA